MVEATNFVEKTLGKRLDSDEDTFTKNNIESLPKTTTSIPTYTPPPTPTQQQPNIQPPVIQIIEKIVYKKQRIHGFFRTLTIIALLAIWFLMLGESTGIINLSVNSFKLHQVFPLFIIFSTIVIRSYRGIFWKIFGLILFLSIFWWMFTIGIYTWLNPSSKRKSWETINYNNINIGQTNLYLQTLIGNSYIEGNTTNSGIQSKRNSDRNLLVSSGINFIKFNEDNNRNVLQKYSSKIDLAVPTNTAFDLIYIKNLFWLHTIDLNTFQWKMLKFHAGIDDITIRVGNVLSGNKIEVQGTAANVDITLPKDVWVNLYYKHLVGKLQLEWFEILSGHNFQSTNITTANAIVDIYINLWAGNTNIHRSNK